MESIDVAKENLFRRFKPAPDGKVVTRTGYVVKSEKVLMLLKELKQFIVKNDPDGFRRFIHTDPRSKALDTIEKQCLLAAIITDNGASVFDLCSDIDDIENP